MYLIAMKFLYFIREKFNMTSKIALIWACHEKRYAVCLLQRGLSIHLLEKRKVI